jgi:hypothetical protein
MYGVRARSLIGVTVEAAATADDRGTVPAEAGAIVASTVTDAATAMPAPTPRRDRRLADVLGRSRLADRVGISILRTPDRL